MPLLIFLSFVLDLVKFLINCLILSSLALTILDEARAMLCQGLIALHYWGKTFLPALFISLWLTSFFSLANGNNYHLLCEYQVLFLCSFQMFVFPGLLWFLPMSALFITQLSTLCRPPGLFFCSVPSAQGLHPVLSTCLSFSRPLVSSPNSRSLVDSTWVPSPCAVAWKFSKGSKLEYSLGSLHLFQESLPFTASSLLSWK